MELNRRSFGAFSAANERPFPLDTRAAEVVGTLSNEVILLLEAVNFEVVTEAHRESTQLESGYMETLHRALTNEGTTCAM